MVVVAVPLCAFECPVMTWAYSCNPIHLQNHIQQATGIQLRKQTSYCVTACPLSLALLCSVFFPLPGGAAARKPNAAWEDKRSFTWQTLFSIVVQALACKLHL
jgi:hypothetical protein